MQAMSAASLRSGRLAGATARGIARKKSSCGSASAAAARELPKRTKGWPASSALPSGSLCTSVSTGATARARSAISGALSSMLSGATTAPRRQAASQIRSFSRFSSERRSTRLPLPTPRALSAAAMSATARSRSPKLIDVSWSRSTSASLSGSRSRYAARRSATGRYGIFGRCWPNTSLMASPSPFILSREPARKCAASRDRPAQLHHRVELQALAEARDCERNLPIKPRFVNLRQAPLGDHVLARNEHVAHRIPGRAVDEVGDRIDQRLPFRTVGVEQYDVRSEEHTSELQSLRH